MKDVLSGVYERTVEDQLGLRNLSVLFFVPDRTLLKQRTTMRLKDFIDTCNELSMCDKDDEQRGQARGPWDATLGNSLPLFQ